MMKVILNGAAGRMGTVLRRMIGEGVRGASLAAAVDFTGGEFLTSVSDFYGEADVIIDFSNHTAAPAVAAYAVSRNLPVVICTTGLTAQERAAVLKAGESVPVFMSANMSLGVALLVELAKKAATCFPDANIEIVECHHNRKLDAPSGTAVMLFDAIKEVRPQAVRTDGRSGMCPRTQDEIGVHALRLGNETGMHEVWVATGNETITLRHKAENRDIFAEGALAAAQFLCGKEPGIYSMRDLMNTEG
ncbi:MAG: 4-hydroxy-tetrahydrodipicolinate reductase [Clostridia bacterium]|nr:4-hydroxy-tetrahydrodipicolinate reductase [Clostridia bacterium]